MASEGETTTSPQPRPRSPGGAGDDSPMRLGLSRAISGAIFVEDDEPNPEQQPLIGDRQGSRADNRRRFVNNQRSAARTSFTNSLVLLAVTTIVLLVWCLLNVYFYVEGWVIWWQHSGKPCDQPLEWWLLVTLLLPLLSCINSCCHFCPFKWCRTLLQSTVQIIVLIVGIYIWWQCKTCATTNPELYYFVRNYLIFVTVSWTLGIVVPLVALGVVVYGMNAGWFDEIKGADPEVIKSIETVDFDPSLFASEDVADDARPDAHCCICTEAFSKSAEIKRTPCNHYFHEECLGKWLKVQVTCPICRLDLQDEIFSSDA